MSATTYSSSRRLSDGFAMFTVMWLSMLCLLYVAHGEATRTYERFQGDKLVGQAQIVENAMETFLRSGLTLKQFIGFNGLSSQILDSDETISSLVVTDAGGGVVFVAGDSGWSDSLTAAAAAAGGAEALPGRDVVPGGVKADGFYREFNGQYAVMVPLNDKFEKVGHLYITMPTTAVSNYVWEFFEPVVYASFAPALLFALIIALYAGVLQSARMPWAQIIFAVIFLTSAAIVVAGLVSLYSEGAQAKAQALAQSLGQRLNPLVQYNLNLTEIDGLDGVFREYLVVNPDLSSAALTVDGSIVIHTDQAQVGQPWVENQDNYQYVVDLTPYDLRDVQVAVELPSDVVLGEILRSVKNFGALFIASAFLANLFFQVGGTAVRRASKLHEDRAPVDGQTNWMLDYVKPVFFLGVLAEHMTYAFLPQHVHAIAVASGVSEGWSMLPFTFFYLTFALTLIPAGYVAQRVSPRPLMYFGLILAGVGLLGTAMTTDFWTMLAARGVSGVGQGMLFIGVQSYLLAVASAQHKTQASAIIVYGFQGGMISGMAVGSLLVGSMGEQGVFALGAVIVGVAAVYSVVTVPRLTSDAMQALSQNASSSLFSSIGKALRDRSFMSAMIGIGLPAKAVLTGVVSFAMPLLLSQALYAQEDIGQMIMVYALAVVASSQLAAPYVDKIRDPQLILVKGAILSGLGLLIIAAAGTHHLMFEQMFGAGFDTVLLVLGIGVVGVAHGLINAPVVTFIANTKISSTIGTGTTTSTYRFLERIGHVAGPMIVGQLFVWFTNDWGAVAWIGGAIIALGLLFMVAARPASGDDARRSATPTPA